MSELTLYIGNKNYSSWSLRAWLTLKQVGTPFKEVVISLEGPGKLTAEIGKYSPSGRVPVLRYGEFVVWDTMAIQEYLAEEFHQAHLWPSDRFARATARSVSAEMHSGFGALRTAMPMNIRRKPFELRRSAEVEADVQRIQAIWSDCRRRFGAGGPFLFGRYSIADSMYAPVATRFRTYGVPLDDNAKAYVEAIYGVAAMMEWVEGAKREYMAIEEYDRVGS